MAGKVVIKGEDKTTGDTMVELIKVWPRPIDRDAYLERITGPRGGNRGYREYNSSNKTLYPSVTSVLQSLAKPALPNWYAKKVAERAGEHWISDAPHDSKDTFGKTKLTGGGYRSTIGLDLFIKDVKSAPREEFMVAGAVGTEAHNCIERIIQSKLNDGYGTYREVGKYITDDFPFSYEKAKNAVNSWIEWISNPDRNFEFLESEFGTLNPIDGLGYAGTVDAVASAHLGGKKPHLIVFDWKTGSGIYPETSLQLAAYMESIWKTFDLRHMYSGIKGCVVRLGTTEHPDTEVKYVRNHQGSYQVFVSLLNVHNNMGPTLLTGDIGETIYG